MQHYASSVTQHFLKIKEEEISRCHIKINDEKRFMQHSMILWTFHCKVKVQRVRQSMLASSATKDSKWKPYSNQCYKCKSETKLLLLLPLALLLLLLLLVLLPLRLRLLLPNHSALLYSPLLSATLLYSPRLDWTLILNMEICMALSWQICHHSDRA